MDVSRVDPDEARTLGLDPDECWRLRWPAEEWAQDPRWSGYTIEIVGRRFWNETPTSRSWPTDQSLSWPREDNIIVVRQRDTPCWLEWRWREYSRANGPRGHTVSFRGLEAVMRPRRGGAAAVKPLVPMLRLLDDLTTLTGRPPDSDSIPDDILVARLREFQGGAKSQEVVSGLVGFASPRHFRKRYKDLQGQGAVPRWETYKSGGWADDEVPEQNGT